MAMAPGFVQVAGFVFAPARPKRKYDKPVATWTNDQKIINDLSNGHSASTMQFKHGKTYLEYLPIIQNKLSREEERLEQNENLIRVCHSDLKTKIHDEIMTIQKNINKLRQQVENIQHNSELELIGKTKYKSEKNIFEVIEVCNPIYVEDEEHRIYPIYFHKSTKIMGTGDPAFPRLGVTFAELGIHPIHFYGITDPKYDMIKASLKS